MTVTAPDGRQASPRQRRRLPMALITWAFVALVLLVVVVLVVLKLTQGSTAPPAPAVARAPMSVTRTITDIPSAAFDAVGASPDSAAPDPIVLTGQAPLTARGLPRVIFVGGEFSPYSAAARWPLVAALARFGTFSDLGSTSSSPVEVFPRTPTFTFDGANYRSRWLVFSGIEAYGDTPSPTGDGAFPVLHAPDAEVAALLRRYDGSGAAGATAALPFIDVGNRVLFVGAAIGLSPSVLHGSGMVQIAVAAADPTTAIGQAVLSSADEISAALCDVTGGRPASLCTSPGVRAGAARLGRG